jgi:hypothetical protein
MAQNGGERRDKHLTAHLIPIGLTWLQQAALGGEGGAIDASR